MIIYCRRVEFGMNHDGMNTNISDEELVVILQQMRRESPNLGERMVIGRLRSMGFKVARARVRDRIRATDPIQTALRWTGQLARRQPYSVPGPNSLWHIGACTFSVQCVSGLSCNSHDFPYFTLLFKMQMSTTSWSGGGL